MVSSRPCGIGIDIIEIERIKTSLENYPERFLERAFTEKERAYFEKFTQEASLLTIGGRFAAKEAIAKALGSGFGEKLSFIEIEILNDEDGKPEATLSERCQKLFGNPHILVSISHCKSYATATAIVFKKPSWNFWPF